MNTPRTLTVEEVMEIRRRFEKGICSVIIGDKCDCGGQVSEIKLSKAGNLEVVCNFFIQMGSLTFFKTDYTLPTGGQQIYLQSGNLCIVDGGTTMVIFPSAFAVSNDLQESLAETAAK